MTIQGTGSAVEFAREATYGQDLVKTTGIPFVTEGWDHTPNDVRSESLRGGNSMALVQDLTVAGITVEGDLVTDFLDRGHLYWFESAMGDYSFSLGSGPGGTNEHTYLVAANNTLHPSLAVDVFMGGTTSVTEKKVTGCIATGFNFSTAVEESTPIQLTFPTIAQDINWTPSETAAGVELSGTEPYNWGGITVNLGGTDVCVEGFGLDVTVNMARKWCLGDVQTQHPDRSGKVEATGNINMYFETEAEMNRLINGDVQPLIVTLGELGTPVTNHQAEFTMGSIRWTAGTAMIDTAERIMVDMQFEALGDTPGDQDASALTVVIRNNEASIA